MLPQTACLLFLIANFASALIPKACITNLTALGGSGICCPIPKDSVYPCGGPGIGTCQRQFVQLQALPHHRLRDDRALWPTRFFKYTCKCESNHFGVACGECWYGWKGKHCDQKHKIVRRNVLSFTPKERKMFVNIVAKTTEVPTDYVIVYEKDRYHSDPLWKPRLLDVHLQYLIAYLHDYASRGTMFKNDLSCQLYRKIDNNHNVVGFSTWHRYYLLFWERELQKIAKKMYGWEDFAVPYWDWTDATNCEVCVNSLVGAPGPFVNGIRLLHPGSPFANWTENCGMSPLGSQCVGCHVTWPNWKPLHRHYYQNDFPTTQELQFALSKDKFYLPAESADRENCRGFHQALEGSCGLPGTTMNMHNKVHNMVAGSFCCSPTAGNDPIFLFHHSQIDRIMQLWFEYYKPTPTDFPNHDVDMGNCRECNIIGFIPPVRHSQMFVDMRDLGIYYDNYRFGKLGYDGRNYLQYGPAYDVTI